MRARILCPLLLALLSLLLPPAPAAGQEALEGPGPAGKWRPYVSAQAKAGETRALGRLGLAAPLWQDEDNLVFADLRMVVDDDDHLEGNAGFGVRHLFWTGDGESGFNGLIAGLYAFYDRRRSSTHHEYDQLTYGAEILGEDFELRANLYCPEADENLLGTRTVLDGFRVSGTYIMRDTSTFAAYERALPGFDAEAGVRLGLVEDVSLWGHAGWYRFAASGFPEVKGPRGRLTLEWMDAWGLAGATASLGLEIQDDDVQGTDTMGFLTVRIPLGAGDAEDSAEYLSPLDRAMERMIVRDVDVIVGQQDLDAWPGSRGGPELTGRGTGSVSNPATGQPLRIWFADADGSARALGTQRQPMTLLQAVAAARRGEIIFLLGGDGRLPVDGLDGRTVPLKGRQQLCGVGGAGGAWVPVPGGSVRVNAPGGRPWLASKSKAPAVTLADGNRVAGIGVSGGVHGIYGLGTDSATIDNVAIRRPWVHGVFLENARGRVTIANSSVSRPGESGVYVRLGENQSLEFVATGNLIRDPSHHGILVNPPAGSRVRFDISGNRFVLTGANGAGFAAAVWGDFPTFGDSARGRMLGNLVTATGTGLWWGGLACGDVRFFAAEISGNRVDGCKAWGVLAVLEIIDVPAVGHAIFRNNRLGPVLIWDSLDVATVNNFSGIPANRRLYARIEGNSFQPGGGILLEGDGGLVGCERLGELSARNHGAPVAFSILNGGWVFAVPPGTVQGP